VKYERWWHKPAPGSEFLDAMNVLKVMVDARSGTAAVDALRLRELTRLGFEESESLLQRMLVVGWVGRVKSEVATSWRLSRKHRKQDRWVLLANPEALTVSDVYQLFAFAPSAHSPLSSKVEQAVERELATPLKNYFNDTLANSNNASST